MRNFWSTLLIITVGLLSQVSAVQADGPWLTDLNKARKIAEETNRPILCHFYADWCGPCQQMERNVFPDASVRQQLQSSVVAVKINTQDQPHLSKRFGISSLPTDIILEPNGKEIVQSSGYRNQSEYVGMMMRARTRYEDLVASRASAIDQANRETIGSHPKTPQPVESIVMLEGYCPVTLWDSRRWEKGSPQFQTEYKGQKYQFASAKLVAEFKKSPERFVPQFLGCDPIVVWETDRAITGDIQYGAFYDEQLYLFTSDENRRRFKSTPDQFIKTQVVLHVDQIQRVVR